MGLVCQTRAQFFIMSIVLLTLALVVLFANFVTIGEISARSFAHHSSSEFQNVLKAIEDHNTYLSQNWFNLTFNKRKLLIIQDIPIGNPVQVDVGFNTPEDISDCAKEIRVVNDSGEVTSHVTSELPPCEIVFDAIIGSYYVYYDNPQADIPSYRIIGQTGNPPTCSVGDIEQLQDLCEHFKYIYPIRGIYFNCSTTLLDDKKFKYYIHFKAPDFEFLGNVS